MAAALLLAFALMPAAAKADTPSIVFQAWDYTSRTYGVYRMPTTGGTIPRILSGRVTGLALSPDGTTIAYTRPNGNLYLNSVGGTSEQRLQPADDPNARISNVRFSASGDSLIGVYSGSLGDGIYAMNLDGSNLHRLVDSWAGSALDNPVMSSNGELAFTANSTPDGHGSLQQIWILDGSGEQPRPVTDPSDVGWTYSPTFSGDAQRLFFTSYDSGGNPSLQTSSAPFHGSEWTPASHVAQGDPVEWETDTPEAEETVLIGGSQLDRSSTATGDTFATLVWPATDRLGLVNYVRERQPAGSAQPPIAAPSLDLDDLLERYRPVMAYDSQERFFADSPAETTDSYLSGTGPGGSDEPSQSNALTTGDGTPIAYANPNLGANALSLWSLDSSSYPGDWIDAPAPSGTDKLNARGSDEETYEQDANRLRNADPGTYADQTYAQARSDPATGDLWLQYWFFYYDNPQNVPIFGGKHEGDWEMIQIRLDHDGAPQQVVYGRHTSGDQERCPWSLVEKDADDPDAPIVYVANGSHANYLTEGPHQVPPLPSDGTDGAIRARPTVNRIEDGSPGWAFWPGSWSGSDDIIRGPGAQTGKWYDPEGFAADANDCPGSAGASARALASPSEARESVQRRARTARSRALREASTVESPTISAVRENGRIRISYRLKRTPLGRTRTALLLTARSRNHRVGPSGRTFAITARRGVRSILAPQGAGPYRISASVILRDGSRSKIATALTR